MAKKLSKTDRIGIAIRKREGVKVTPISPPKALKRRTLTQKKRDIEKLQAQERYLRKQRCKKVSI